MATGCTSPCPRPGPRSLAPASPETVIVSVRVALVLQSPHRDISLLSMQLFTLKRFGFMSTLIYITRECIVLEVICLFMHRILYLR